MNVMKYSRTLFIALLIGLAVWGPSQAVFADTGAASSVSDAAVGQAKQQVDDISAQVKAKQQTLKELDAVIGKYKDRIQEQANAQATLQNEVGLLDNRIQERQLAVERTKAQIDLALLEQQRVEAQISLAEQQFSRKKETLGSILGELQDAQGVSLFEAFLSNPSLSEFFARVEQLNFIETDVTDAVTDLKTLSSELNQKKAELETYRTQLETQRADLEKVQMQLEGERSAKTSLLAETSQQESEFQRILYELRQQQQEEANAAASLEEKLKAKLDTIDSALARGDVLLNWPVPHSRITTEFHDPDYPFRKLFEHPGIDIAVPRGTPVHAAAGGYIAFTRTGTQYGNYIMIVHSGGAATVYAHLSKFNVKPDTYVERGDVIGYSGGVPGDQGAGLSTGAHLHFEVRQNGIPTNPRQFLPSA